MWTWRQLLNLGYDARFIGGRHGRYGAGHAWVEYFQDDKWFLLEPQYCRAGATFPQLSVLRYEPKLSVSWDGKTLRYFAHNKPDSQLEWRTLVPLVGDYLLFWSWFWLRNLHRLPLIPWKILRRRVLKRDLWRRPREQAR